MDVSYIMWDYVRLCLVQHFRQSMFPIQAMYIYCPATGALLGRNIVFHNSQGFIVTGAGASIPHSPLARTVN